MAQVNTIKRVKKVNTLSIEGGFEKGYMALTANVQRQVRRDIMEECGWNDRLFIRKLKGIAIFTRLEARYLRNYFFEYNLNAFTGEKIK